jgi:diguanylate cyclase (GGDEF)-like protein
LAATAIQNGQLVDKLRHKADHDALTGLLNRVGFRQHIDRVLDPGTRGPGRAGLLFVDLDDFKAVNDAYGHEAGDELIRKTAHRLESSIRAGDAVARLGGDEFVVVLADVGDRDELRAASTRLRAAFRDDFTLEGVAISVDISIGAGLWPDDGRTVNELLSHADAAMYEDKAKGRRTRINA